MPSVYRLAMPALCLSLILPCAFSVNAADPTPAAEKPAEEKPAERQPLLERSQEEAAALERKVPAQEQQQLQAGSDSFLALWKPANTAEPKGAVIIIPGAGETADWPQAIGPLRRKLPDAQWSSLSITLPDLQSDAIAPRVVEAQVAPAPESGSRTPPPRSQLNKPLAVKPKWRIKWSPKPLKNNPRLTPNASSRASTPRLPTPNSRAHAALSCSDTALVPIGPRDT